jgi:TRAP-type C4-dicarboxylate transport system substrate-binding protein
MTKKIRWVLAHEPIELFIRAAKVFEAEVAKRSEGAFEIEVLTLSEYSDKYQAGKLVTKHDLVDLLDSGEIEMSQTYTVSLGAICPEFRALDMPFLFKDHDHASRVFEGEVGKDLMSNLSKTGKAVKGLAFTYSGGFRIVPGQEAVRRIEDLRGMKIRTSFSPVAIDTFKAMGADVVPMELEELTDKIASADVTVGESTYPRVYALGQDKVSKVVNHTEHSLFLTSILIAEGFWNELSEADQKIVSDAAVVAAKYERSISIDDIATTQARCEADNIEVVRLSKEEQERFAAATAHLYEKDYGFDHAIVDAIKRA